MERREFVRDTGAFLLTLTMGASPRSPFPETIPSHDPEKEKLEKLRAMGIDGNTVWTAKNLPLHLKHLSTKKDRYQVLLDGVDLQMDYPFLGDFKLMPIPRRALFGLGIPEIKQQEVFAEIPTSTGTFAQYIVDLGYFVGNRPVIRAEILYRGKVFACYFHCEQYYDNKIFNATLAVLRMAETMLENPIKPGETFSFLEAAQIGSLIANKEVLNGWGLVKNANGEVIKKPMYGGGICSSASALVKMIRQAELRNGSLNLIESHPHSDKRFWYFINQADPDSPYQKDATAYSPDKDLTAKNQTEEELYIIPKVQIIPWREPPEEYDPFNDSTGTLVMSFTLTNQPITRHQVLLIEKELRVFRTLRGL
jgi:hypothetical protein